MIKTLEGKEVRCQWLGGTYRLTEFHVDRFAVTANAVQHPGLDTAATHSAGAQLTGAPLWWWWGGGGGVGGQRS